MTSVLLVGKGPPDAGGISAMLVTLMRELEGRFDVQLLNLTTEADYKAGVLSLSNVTRTIRDVRALLDAARHVDVVHLHTAFVPTVTILRAALLLAAARRSGARTILHVHGGGLPAWMSTSWKRMLVRRVIGIATATVAVSDAIGEALDGPAVRIIYNGVDTNTFHPSEKRQTSTPRVVFVGLLTRRKGATDLIEAAELLEARGVELDVTLIGGRPDEGDEEEAIVRSKAGAGATLLGARPHEEMPELLREADVFCLPSWFEAMPLSILEAMATGLPVVATRVGQIPQVVDSEVGEVVAPRNPAQLADALERLVTDPDLRVRKGEAARERAVDRFSIEGTVSAIARLIDEICGDTARS